MGFKKGLLFVRVLSGQYMELFYTYRDVPDDYSVFHPQGVATVYAGRTEPHFGSATDSAHDGDLTSSGRLVQFRRATDNDIRWFLGNWNPRSATSVSEWADQVQKECPELFDKEKSRVVRIAGEFD